MSEIFFKPFVGKSYEKGLFGKRVMILGESHYGEDGEGFTCDMTQAVLKIYLEYRLNKNGKHQRWMNTFLKFERSLVDRKTEGKESEKIWNSLIFYNYLQEPMSGPRKVGTKEQYKNAENAFFEVVEDKQPEYIIVWGKRLYNSMPMDGWKHCSIIEVDGKKTAQGIYTTCNNVKVMAVNHPSSAYSWSYWHKVIGKFLEVEI